MITINRIPGGNGAYDSVSVALVDMARDESAGNTLKAGVAVDPALVSAAPAPALYASYYPTATLHEAPLISITDRGTDLTRSLSIIQCSTPTSMSKAAAALDGPAPSPAAYRAFDKPERLNKAPCIQATFVSSDFNSAVSSPVATIPLDYAGAAVIFKQYRKA
jgi:hypothetical protein